VKFDLAFHRFVISYFEPATARRRIALVIAFPGKLYFFIRCFFDFFAIGLSGNKAKLEITVSRNAF